MVPMTPPLSVDLFTLRRWSHKHRLVTIESIEIMRHFRRLFLMNNTSVDTKPSCISNVQLMNCPEMLELMYDNTDFFIYFTISVHAPQVSQGQVTKLPTF